MSDETKEREWNSEIKKLGDEIVELKLLQAKELADYLKEVHGIEPAAAPVAMMAAAPGAGAEAPEEPSTFDVILTSFGERKINVIRVVREITGLGLKEAKALVDGVPGKIKEGVSKEEAEELKKKVEGEGATVELK